MSRHHRRHRNVCFTLDVLTDGSEHTGSGTLFLSVWKVTPAQHQQHDSNAWKDVMENTTPSARYAISGLGDATARLCADQRWKLAPTRAVFLQSMNPGSSCGDGLSALILALHNAGAPSLHVIANDNGVDGDGSLEELAAITLGTRRHLQIMTCSIPKNATGIANEKGKQRVPCWWKVYDDEYLTVHASLWSDETMTWDNDSVIYLFTIHSQGDDKNDAASTIAVLPSQSQDIARTYHQALNKADLPLIQYDDDGDDIPMSIDYAIALNPSSIPNDWNTHEFDAKLLVTKPNQVFTNNGILIRSQQVGRYFQTNMPWAFPLPKSSVETTGSATTATTTPCSTTTDGPIIVLQSCSSLVLQPKSQPHLVLNRARNIWDRPLSDEWSATLDSLRSFLPPPPSADDDNEIDLEEIADDDNGGCGTHTTAFPTVEDPQLIVLGTGCASPCAYRGSSGYALIFPNADTDNDDVDIFILDCGEGVTTMLSRNCSNRIPNWASRIKGIWISHAHLDHYGGLATLVRVIWEHQTKIDPMTNNRTTSVHQMEHPSPAKKLKLDEHRHVPWIVAPNKVLRYLDILLQCRHGRRRSDSEQMFYPKVHHDPEIPRGPWTWFRNIKVYHNCCPSYGLLLGWRNPRYGDKTHWICFSGDTRPSLSLVKACREALWRDSKIEGNFSAQDLLLIHEATFQEEEQEEALKRKHSTVAEAIQIAADIPANRVLLTHFSQRYVSMTSTIDRQPLVSFETSSRRNVPVGFAMDGLWVPLTNASCT